MPKLNVEKFNEQRYAGMMVSLNNFIELDIAHRLSTQLNSKLADEIYERKKEAFLVLVHSIDPSLVIPD